MSTTEIQYDITHGPNRNDLVTAFLYANDGEIGKEFCVFTIGNAISPKINVKMHLTMLQHEDGTPYTFNFEGYYQPTVFDKEIKARGFYNAKTRNGTLIAIHK